MALYILLSLRLDRSTIMLQRLSGMLMFVFQRADVLIFGSEGATDPELYAQIVGKVAEEVFA